MLHNATFAGTNVAVEVSEPGPAEAESDVTGVIQALADTFARHFVHGDADALGHLGERKITSTVGATSNDWLRALQIGWTQANRARVAAGKLPFSCFECRQKVIDFADDRNLDTFRRAHLEWAAVVRVALLDRGDSGETIRSALRGRVAAKHAIRDLASRDAVHQLVVEPCGRYLNVRKYRSGVDADGSFVHGGAGRCVLCKDLWASPGVKRPEQLAAEYQRRGADAECTASACARLERSHRRKGLMYDFWPRIAGFAIDEVGVIYEALELIEALIATVVAERQWAYLDSLAPRTGLSADYTVYLLTFVDPDEEIPEADEDESATAVTERRQKEEERRDRVELEERLGKHFDEVVEQVARYHDALTRVQIVSPFVQPRLGVAFTRRPGIVDANDGEFYAGKFIMYEDEFRQRGDRKMLLRHANLVRDYDRYTGKWIPRIYMDAQPVVAATQCACEDGEGLLPQVQIVTLRARDRGMIPFETLDTAGASSKVQISRQHTRKFYHAARDPQPVG